MPEIIPLSREEQLEIQNLTLKKLLYQAQVQIQQEKLNYIMREVEYNFEALAIRHCFIGRKAKLSADGTALEVEDGPKPDLVPEPAPPAPVQSKPAPAPAPDLPQLGVTRK